MDSTIYRGELQCSLSLSLSLSLVLLGCAGTHHGNLVSNRIFRGFVQSAFDVRSLQGKVSQRRISGAAAKAVGGGWNSSWEPSQVVTRAVEGGLRQHPKVTRRPLDMSNCGGRSHAAGPAHFDCERTRGQRGLDACILPLR